MSLEKNIRLIRDLHLQKQLSPCVATIGNFDGLHRGHRQIIDQMVSLAKYYGLPATVITFEPSPVTYLHPHVNIFRLTSLSEKIRLLARWGVQQVVCLRFNNALAQLSAQEFIKTVLCDTLKIKGLVIGEDFRFGHKQQGDVQLLESHGLQAGFEVQKVTLIHEQVTRISSTAIREALINGDLKRASSQLGRHFCVTKRVIKGEQRGQQWGFPTANLPIHAKAVQFKGVFITRVWVDGTAYWAVTNVGRRPSVDGRRYLIESHILNFKDNLYGKRITVEFLQKIRDEKRFDSIDALCAQIQFDIQHAKKWIEYSQNVALT